MKYLLNIINKTLKLMKYPYNDKKTEDYISEVTHKTIEYCKKLKGMKGI